MKKNKIDFIKKVKHREAIKFLDEAEKRGIEVGMITEWGAVIPDNARFVLELGEETDDTENLVDCVTFCPRFSDRHSRKNRNLINGNVYNYIATTGFLQRSKDGVFVRLKKDGKEIKIPNFEDIFEIINLSENYKQIRFKE